MSFFKAKADIPFVKGPMEMASFPQQVPAYPRALTNHKKDGCIAHDAFPEVS